jgi:hypothetical protein
MHFIFCKFAAIFIVLCNYAKSRIVIDAKDYLKTDYDQREI